MAKKGILSKEEISLIISLYKAEKPKNDIARIVGWSGRTAVMDCPLPNPSIEEIDLPVTTGEPSMSCFYGIPENERNDLTEKPEGTDLKSR